MALCKFEHFCVTFQLKNTLKINSINEAKTNQVVIGEILSLNVKIVNEAVIKKIAMLAVHFI